MNFEEIIAARIAALVAERLAAREAEVRADFEARLRARRDCLDTVMVQATDPLPTLRQRIYDAIRARGHSEAPAPAPAAPPGGGEERERKGRVPSSEKRDGGPWTFCPECGPDVYVDEDGCCLACGATAMGEAVDALRAREARVQALVEAAREIRGRWEGVLCIVSPPCGACGPCRFGAALDALEEKP